jgi:AraC-like DNA-binding protein
LEIKTYKTEIFPDLIERIWIADNHTKAVDLLVPPNQYMNMIFPVNGSKYSHNGEWIQEPHIEGISLQSTHLNYTKDTKLIGIRFYPHGLYSFVNITGHQLLNKSINLLPLIKGHSYPLNFSKEEQLSYIYSLLLKLFNAKRYDKLKILRDYYQYFRAEHSMSSIYEFCELNNTNYTSLNRLFSKTIGISPKHFERLIKFRKTLCSIIDSPENLTNIGIASGYFDQAHFIREFKLFLNTTPSAYQALIKSADKESSIINYNFRLF